MIVLQLRTVWIIIPSPFFVPIDGLYSKHARRVFLGESQSNDYRPAYGVFGGGGKTSPFAPQSGGKKQRIGHEWYAEAAHGVQILPFSMATWTRKGTFITHRRARRWVGVNVFFCFKHCCHLLCGLFLPKTVTFSQFDYLFIHSRPLYTVVSRMF